MLQAKPTCWVRGFFDPLLAEHVRRLRNRVKPGHLLVVEILEPEKPLLPQRARAELVAALSMVDYVIMGNGAPSDAAQSAPLDSELTERFIEHVLHRHRGEAQ